MLGITRSTISGLLFGTTLSWEWTGSKYVGQFRKNLDALANEITELTGHWTMARYDRERGEAELFQPCERTVAWIAVNGECCLATTILVDLPQPIEKQVQELFLKHLRHPLEGPGPSSGMTICFR